MDTAATETKPKRSRAKKAVDAVVEAVAPAKPKTHRELMAEVDARAAETRARVQAELTEKGYGPKPRTASKWMVPRTKGQPYSRCVVKQVIPGVPGTPGQIIVKSPTRRTKLHTLPPTEANLMMFLPSLPPALTGAMLGLN